MFDNRIGWIDSGKGIGIISLLLITHNFFLPSILLNIDGYVLMPFFFFLSGVVFKRKSVSLVLVRKTKALLIPYLFFCLLVGIPLIVFTPDLSFISLTKAIIKGTPDDLLAYFCNPLWFLFTLFFINLICCIKRKIIILLIVFLGILLSKIKGGTILWNIDVICFSTIFFYLGFSLKQYINVLNCKFVFITSVILFFLVFYFNNYRNILAYNMIDNFVVFMILSILGIVILVNISCYTQNLNWLKSIGNSSLIYMGYHWAILHGMCYYVFSIDDNVLFDQKILACLYAFLFLLIQLVVVRILIRPTKNALKKMTSIFDLLILRVNGYFIDRKDIRCR